MKGLIKAKMWDVEWFIQVILFKKQLNFLKTMSIELQKNYLMRKYFFDYVNIKICNAFVLLQSYLFLTMDNHCFELLKKKCSVNAQLGLRAILKKKKIVNCFVQRNFTKWLVINIFIHFLHYFFFNESERQAHYRQIIKSIKVFLTT